MQLRTVWMTYLLLAASLPAWGLTVRPGQWEVTRLAEGDAVPREQREETTIKECITPEEASDMAVAARHYMADAGCSDISVAEDEDVVSASALCRSPSGNQHLESRLTVHSYEYFTSAIESTKGDTSSIHRQESHWVAKECDAPIDNRPALPPETDRSAVNSITED